MINIDTHIEATSIRTTRLAGHLSPTRFGMQAIVARQKDMRLDTISIVADWTCTWRTLRFIPVAEVFQGCA